MVRCDMCGMEVPVGPNGTCFLGHRLPDVVAASASAAMPQPEPSPISEPMPQPPLISVADVSDAVAPASMVVTPSSPEPVLAADAPLFPTTISPDLIAAAIAEVEKPAAGTPSTLTPPRPLGSPPPADAPSSPTAPRPLGSPAPAAFTPPRPLGEAQDALVFGASSQPSASVAPMPVVTPPASSPVGLVSSAELGGTAPPAPAVPFGAGSLQTSGSVALAEAPHAAAVAAAPVADMFVVNSPAAPKSKLIMLIAVGIALIVAAVGLKTFVFKAEPQLAGFDSGPALRQPETLVRAFVAGESHRYEVRATVTTTLTADGESMDNEAVVDAVLTESILKRTQDGTTTARYSFDRMKVTVDGQTVAVPHSPGAGVIVTMDKRGRVTDVKQDARGGIPMQADLSLHEMFAPVLPFGAAPGDRWTRVDETTVPGFPEPVKATSRFYLKSVKDGKGLLESSTEVPVNITIPVAEVSELFGDASGGEVTVRGRFLGTGSQAVDLASGRSLSASGDMAVTLAFFQGETQMARMAMKINLSVREAGGVSATAA